MKSVANGNHSPSPSKERAEAPIHSPPNESDIEEYLDLGICNKDNTLEILLVNGLHLNKVFKLAGLS
ncbi:hypothetical protein VP01_4443g3 [Puccinia sorghi]|uniref:Uncharacterized protein n=1 Tax=Puccinia sorghi TaxID=27349 RepID=A0A0L6UPF1_9BASI|nr:hypothetical protein VP01_4443g3 [Puccinia sorghi]